MRANASQNLKINICQPQLHRLTLSFGKDNLGLYRGKSVCDKYQSFTGSSTAVVMVHGESPGLWI